MISSSGFNSDTTTPAKKAPNIYSAPTPSARATSKMINAKMARMPICVVPPIKRCIKFNRLNTEPNK